MNIILVGQVGLCSIQRTACLLLSHTLGLPWLDCISCTLAAASAGPCAIQCQTPWLQLLSQQACSLLPGADPVLKVDAEHAWHPCQASLMYAITISSRRRRSMASLAQAPTWLLQAVHLLGAGKLLIPQVQLKCVCPAGLRRFAGCTPGPCGSMHLHRLITGSQLQPVARSPLTLVCIRCSLSGLGISKLDSCSRAAALAGRHACTSLKQRHSNSTGSHRHFFTMLSAVFHP